MATFWPDLLIFNVDFNERDPQDASRVIASRTFSVGGHLPALEERVVLQDDEGNQCEGRVKEVLDPAVLVEPDQGTWRHTEGVEFFGRVHQRASFHVPTEPPGDHPREETVLVR